MGNGKRVIYILDRFPSDTLNFIYNEIRVLEEQGFTVDIYSLLPANNCPVEAEIYLARTKNVRPVPLLRLIAAIGFYLLRHPLRLLTLLAIPFDNDAPGKVIRSFMHLAHGICFARLVRGRPEHLHAHFAFKAALAALVAARLNGNSFSFTAHGSASIHPPDRYCLKSKLMRASFVVAVSAYNRRKLREVYPGIPRERIPVSHCGILREQFEFIPRESRTPGPLKLVCVASLYAIKNHEGLLKACALIKAQGYRFHLDLLGKDEDGRRQYLENLAVELGIAAEVDFHGVVDHGEVAQHLRTADLFVLASHSEGIPVSVMEAMAMGTPILAPRVTGLPELVEEGISGLLAAPDRPEEFAEAMIRVADEPELGLAMARRARERIESRFDMEMNSRNVAQLFGDLIPD
ncbi:MAG: glycosyltransferase family 4 protein [bacterium]|nr:glycosyltransferase family 4 protein [bacterium]